jgi:LTXXQ motif family protein
MQFTMQNKTKLIALAALFPAALFAQRPFGVLTSSTPPDTATLVANQVARLTSLLSLTSSQQSEATTIFTNAANAISPLQTTMRTDYTSLQTAVKSNAISTIDQLSSAIGSLYGQIVDIQNKADAAFYAILTSAQQTTLGNTPFPGGPGFGIAIGPGPGGPPPGN